MASYSNKLTKDYVYQITFIIWNKPLAKLMLLWIVGQLILRADSTAAEVLVLVTNLSSVHFMHENRKKANKKAAKIEKFAHKLVNFTSDMEDRRVLFEADALSNVEVIRLCSAAVIMHCLELKQESEVLHSVALQASTSSHQLDMMKQKLQLQGMKIENLMDFYREYRISLLEILSGVQLAETPQEWVARTNKMFASG
ncbi:uncharacterized protein EV420DRAFT_1749148 [Desarmillaria tabescens]|uniref:Uncharacterized protein n=1 Tax=Armillaria tabescens TaxID=1929756 RepID=A0AA39K959_ARMTA|nr:uncharacterized protein EV420DRAFT_1749148 [Desarmillaria tabescens]KAK0455730.1 hypothetical protein EV420DRAFT_1749148 [Desarmillaria tabescens]